MLMLDYPHKSHLKSYVNCKIITLMLGFGNVL